MEDRLIIFPILALCSYLLGSVPFGLVVVRLKGGLDPRKAGSGNIGATNVGRTSGKAAGIITLALDALKGAVPVLLALYVFEMTSMEAAVVGTLAFLGHVFPLYLGFRGGKGVATALGVFATTAPYALLISLGLFILLLLIFRYVSLASISAAALLPPAAFLLGYDRWFVISAALISLLTIIKHGSNIKRLLGGTENKFGKKG